MIIVFLQIFFFLKIISFYEIKENTHSKNMYRKFEDAFFDATQTSSVDNENIKNLIIVAVRRRYVMIFLQTCACEHETLWFILLVNRCLLFEYHRIDSRIRSIMNLKIWTRKQSIHSDYTDRIYVFFEFI